MSGFNFATTDDATTTTNDDAEETEATPDFEPNETAALYMTATDAQRTVSAIRSELGLDSVKVWSDDQLGDLKERLEENSDAHPMQKLEVVYQLFRHTAGTLQQDNDHAIGFVDKRLPESHDEVSQDFSYALFDRDLQAITWDDLDGGERENLEEMGIDPADLGFDPDHGGPKLLSIDGERLPIVVTKGGDELTKAQQILQKVPDEPSKWVDGALVESSHPEVFGEATSDGEESSTAPDKGDDADDGDDTEAEAEDPTTIIENPGLIGQFKVNEVKGVLNGIDSKRTVQQLIKHEEDGKNRSSLVGGDDARLYQKLRATKESDSDDDGDGEAETETNDDEGDEADDSEENFDADQVAQVYGLNSLEKEAIQFRVESGKADSLQEAAEQVIDDQDE